MMNDELTTMLNRQLHEQVDDWQATPLTLDGVRGKARSIRRTRRIAAGAAVAAVFAISAPVAVLATGGLDAGPDREVPPATNTPTEAVEQQPSEIGVPFLEGRTLTMPDGTETELPRSYDAFTVVGDRVLAAAIDTDDGSATLERLEGGEVVGTEDLAGGTLTPNDDGTAVAYVRADGQLVVESESGQALLGEYAGARPVALLGGAECTEQPGSCVVFVESGEGTPLVVTTSGATPVSGDPVAVEDASAATGRVALLMSVDDLEPGSCSRVVSNDGAEGTVFETCDVSLDTFSPGGSHLSAGPEYRSGIGDGFVAIVDGETGEEQARFSPENGFVHTSVWEDEEHLLVLAHDWEAQQWSVFRLASDGSLEEAMGPVAGGEMKPPWRLLQAG